MMMVEVVIVVFSYIFFNYD